MLEAIRAEGLIVDSSATDASWHAEELAGLPLLERLQELWADVDRLTQPYLVETAHGEVLEMPDTGALADYLSGAEMNEHVEGLLEAMPEEGLFFGHIGFHQETADRFLPGIVECLERWADDERVRFVTLEAAAELWRGQRPAAQPATGDEQR